MPKGRQKGRAPSMAVGGGCTWGRVPGEGFANYYIALLLIASLPSDLLLDHFITSLVLTYCLLALKS